MEEGGAQLWMGGTGAHEGRGDGGPTVVRLASAVPPSRRVLGSAARARDRAPDRRTCPLAGRCPVPRASRAGPGRVDRADEGADQAALARCDARAPATPAPRGNR